MTSSSSKVTDSQQEVIQFDNFIKGIYISSRNWEIIFLLLFQVEVVFHLKSHLRCLCFNYIYSHRILTEKMIHHYWTWHIEFNPWRYLRICIRLLFQKTGNNVMDLLYVIKITISSLQGKIKYKWFWTFENGL